jgi:2-dehydropantoate 2-reductase
VTVSHNLGKDTEVGPKAQKDNMLELSECTTNLRGSKICIAGTHAVATDLASRMATNGLEITVLNRQRNFREQSGLELLHQNSDGSVKAAASKENGLEPLDIIFLCSKAQDLIALASIVSPSIRPNTLVVPVLSGIPWWYFEGCEGRFAGRAIKALDPDEKLKTLIPSGNIIGSVAVFDADKSEAPDFGGEAPLQMVIGELDGKHSVRSNDLADLLMSCGVETTVSDQIRDAVWTKAITDLMSEPLSVVAQASLQDVCRDTPLAKIAGELIMEGAELAATFAMGSDLIPEKLLRLAASRGNQKAAMLQDFENGRPLDFSAICGAMMELGELQGVPMPMTKYISMLAKYKNANVNCLA